MLNQEERAKDPETLSKIDEKQMQEILPTFTAKLGDVNRTKSRPKRRRIERRTFSPTDSKLLTKYTEEMGVLQKSKDADRKRLWSLLGLTNVTSNKLTDPAGEPNSEGDQHQGIGDMTMADDMVDNPAPLPEVEKLGCRFEAEIGRLQEDMNRATRLYTELNRGWKSTIQDGLVAVTDLQKLVAVSFDPDVPDADVHAINRMILKQVRARAEILCSSLQIFDIQRVILEPTDEADVC